MTAHPLNMLRQGGDTCGRILDAAEALFAAQGFDGTSMRVITSRAGVNLAAINYHFGSKQGLFEAVFHRRFAQLNAARTVVMDGLEAQAQGAPIKPSQILEGFFGPALAMAGDTEQGGFTFMRLLARTYSEPTAFIRTFMAREHADVMNRYVAALYRALPGVPAEEILWRLHFMLGAVSYAISGIDALRILGGPLDDDPAQLGPRLMAFLLGGLRAPLPDATPPTAGFDQAASAPLNPPAPHTPGA